VILDDICDTGKTLAQLAKVVNGFSAKSIKIGVLVTRPDKEHEIEPDYSGLTCS
jgi:hypoxanthine-guanine phosphoribosyltransferase